MSSVERDRLAELRDAFERRSGRRGLGAHRQLVQVYDGGSIPTAVPAMFLARPVGIGCDETEGASASISVDSTQTIPVLVLGPEVPAAGDNLIATVIGGRWVAGMQGGASDSCACLPCAVPRANVTLSELGGPGTSTMVWQDPDCFWLVDFGGDVTFGLTCDGVGTTLTWVNFDASETMGVNLEESTCDPLHLVFDSTLAGPNKYFIDYP